MLGSTIVNANARTPGPQPLAVTRIDMHDLNGNRLTNITSGEQVMIVTTFICQADEDVSFLGIIEIQDESGATLQLASQSGTLEPLGKKTIGASWVVPSSSVYIARAFALSNLENPQVLSQLTTIEIGVETEVRKP